MTPSTSSLLARALELLQGIPLKSLPVSTRARVRSLFDDAGLVAEPAEAPTESDRPRLFPVHVTAAQRFVLEQAVSSERLAGTFNASARDFLLVAARGFAYQPPPSLTSLDVGAPADASSAVFAFTQHEVEDVRARAVDAGVAALDRYILGCGFAFLVELHARWPDDPKLAPLARASRVPVLNFGKAP